MFISPVISPVYNNSCRFFSVYLSLKLLRSLHKARLRASKVQRGLPKVGLAGGKLDRFPSVMQCFSRPLNRSEGNVDPICLEHNCTSCVGKCPRSTEVECQGHDFVPQTAVYMGQPYMCDSTERGVFIAQRHTEVLLATLLADQSQRQSLPQKLMKILTRKQLWNKFHHIYWHKKDIICNWTILFT